MKSGTADKTKQKVFLRSSASNCRYQVHRVVNRMKDKIDKLRIDRLLADRQIVESRERDGAVLDILSTS